METYISMLRGINLGKHRRIKMEELKELYESLNFKNVKTYIQSGNVVFKYRDIPSSKLAEKIEEEIKEVFDFDVSVIMRTKNEFMKIISDNPFKYEDISKLHVTFLSDFPQTLRVWDIENRRFSNAPDEKFINEISVVKDESEKFFVFGKEIYLFLPKGYGRTKLSNNFFEKKLKLNATTRNWKTVTKLFSIAKEIEEARIA